MAEYESQKRRWKLKPKVLVISLYILTCIASTKGSSSIIEFANRSVDHWEFLFGASSKEFLYDFCKYNGTSEGLQCKNFPKPASVDFEKVCNCNIQHNGSINDGSFSFQINCKSDLSYCPKELTLNYRQGSYVTDPPKGPIQQGLRKNNDESSGNPTGSGIEADPDNAMNEINGIYTYISLALFLFIFFTFTLKIFLCLIRKRNQSGLNCGISCVRVMDREREVNDVGSAEKVLLKIPRDSENIDQIVSTVSKLEPDAGCIMTCLFGPMCQNEQKEVCVRVGQETRPITDILHSLVDPNDKKLIGKPKILIVANVEAPQTENIHADLKDLQVSATNHNGWLVLNLKHEDAVKKLAELFGKIGEKSL